MSNYGQAAVKAVKLCGRSPVPDPVASWSVAVREFCQTLEGQKKSCPRSTFLGLCEEGVVRGVPGGSYTRSKRNKAYAIQAVRVLRVRPSLAETPNILWHEVMAGQDKQPNGQMEVVVALWQAELLDTRTV